MKVADFDRLAKYDHWIIKEADDRGELIHIRFVEYGFETASLLKRNGYVNVFSGSSADGYQLPGYRQVLVKKGISSEGPDGVIIATKMRDVFDKEGKKISSIWDTRHCSIGGLDYDLLQFYPGKSWMRVIWLEDKYVEFFEKIKDERWKKSYITKMTYQEAREIVDNGKASEILEMAKNPKGDWRI